MNYAQADTTLLTQQSTDAKPTQTLPRGVLPTMPFNDRILVRPYPVMEYDGLIKIPDEAKQFRNGGWLLAAGLAALDKLYDGGIEVGDEIEWGKYAGVWDEWDHIVEDGHPNCGIDAHKWGPRTCPTTRTERYVCETCGAVRIREPLWLMNVDDILGCVSQTHRLAAGLIEVVRKENNKGQIQHFIERTDKER